jgi:hypothetical protein
LVQALEDLHEESQLRLGRGQGSARPNARSFEASAESRLGLRHEEERALPQLIQINLILKKKSI